MLHDLRYSLRTNRKTQEGRQHPDRDPQFRYINNQVCRFQRKDEPTISVDAKEKELVGDFKTSGRDWRPKEDPEPVRVHDFVIPAATVEVGAAHIRFPHGSVDHGLSLPAGNQQVEHNPASLALVYRHGLAWQAVN